MSKVTDMSQDYAQKMIDSLKEKRTALSKKSAEAVSQIHFIEWNTKAIIVNETMTDLWLNVLGYIKRNPDKDELVLNFLAEYAKYFRDQIVGHTSCFSTNPIANYIDQIKYDTYREFVLESFNPESIQTLISKLKKMV